MSGRLSGRRLLVVGGGSRPNDDADAPLGNGRAIAVEAAREGAAVAVSDIDRDAAEATAALVRDADGRAHVLVSDAGDPAACERAVADAAEALGGLDALVLNVGIGKGLGLGGTTVDDWDDVMAVNLRAHFLS
ncbi:MAG TPA: SDR family NAD(P)-dependent oxidoreductase, partial [Solirubrobacteraceae bacterium]|nr:SDR family NAD(P)-dependent oxidoreductase [Solirubrobacteraceae bacterium]